jgi:hypothetical protein
MSTVALFVALGGGAYAFSLGKDSVGPRQIADGAVGSPEVKDGSLRGKDIRKNSVTGRQVSEDSLRLPLAATSSASVPAFFCDLSAPGTTACGRITLKTRTRGRILAFAGGTITPPSGNVGLASCSLVVDGARVAQAGNLSEGQPRDFALSGVSARLAAGDHEIAVNCERSSIDPVSRIDGESLSALLVARG